jgi:tetratricopeptide (TPR) repeat protein
MPHASTDPDCTIPAAELLRFAAGASRGAERRRILEHVLAGCERCRQSLDALRELRGEAEAAGPEPEEPSITRILAGLGERASRIDRERREARGLLEEFARHPPARQWTLVRNSRRFDTWSFCAALLERAFEALYDDPHRALDLAEMAHEIADRIEAAPYGERLVADLRGRAWAHLGNARRALGDLPAAAEALARARECLDDGTGDPLDEAELLYFEASLLRAQRRLDDALRKIRRSIRLYHELGDRQLEGRSSLNEASILTLRGEHDLAVATVRKALGLIDPERDSHLALAARHNLVWALMESGRLEEAQNSLANFRDEYSPVGDLSTWRRLEWLQARLLEQAGQADEAAAAFRRAIDGFGTDELPYEVAMASLDLALLEVRRGRLAEVRQLAGDTLVLFRSLGVAREAIAAWLVFQKAAETEAVTVALVERLARYYAETRLRPGRPFEA